MSAWDSIILGIIQGLTEFLPVSSSGHLALGQDFLGFQFHDLTIDIVTHLATLIVVLFYFRKLIINLIWKGIEGVKNKKVNLEIRFILLLVVGTLPAAIIGLLFKDFFESLFSNVSVLAYGFMITGIILFLTRNAKSANLNMDYKDFSDLLKEFENWSYKKALFVGCMQAFAIIPAISRSGSTIAAGIFTGLSGQAASAYSFMLAIPTILGASVLVLKDATFTSESAVNYGAGFISGILFGFIGLHLVLRVVRKGKLTYFSYYLWALSAFLLYHLYT